LERSTFHTSSRLVDMDMGFATFPQGKESILNLALRMRTSLLCVSEKIATPFRAQVGRLENVWLLCWLLKDLGWALYFGPLAWSAALAAIMLQSHDVLHQWDAAPVGELVLNLATLAWLIASSVWMTAQLLFEPEIHKSRASPWYSGAIFNASPQHYYEGVCLMQAIDMAALFGLLVFYAAHVRAGQNAALAALDPTGEAIRQRNASEGRSRTPVSFPAEPGIAQNLVFGVLTPEVYSKLFIVPWILKDLFWSRRSFIPAILCMLILTIMMADYLFLFAQWKSLAMLLWTTGSAVWIAHDLVMHDQEIWPLVLSILLFAVGACILGANLIAQLPRARASEKCSKEEAAPLLARLL